MGQSWRSLASDAHGTELTASIRFEIPLGNRAASGAYRQAQAQVRAAEARRAAVELELRSAIASALASLRQGRQRVELLQEALDLAGRSARAAEARSRAGRSTVFDVSRKQQDLADAQLRELRARTDYAIARAELDSLPGR